MSEAKPEERRKHARTYTHLPVVVQDAQGRDTILEAQTMNISKGGVQLLASQAVAESERLKILHEGVERGAIVLESKPFYGGYLVRCMFLEQD